jgi:hypothetical protein
MELVLTSEQAQLLGNTSITVPVRDPGGHLVGYLTPTFTAAEIAKAQRELASDAPRLTTAKVQEYLKSLASP